MPEQLAVLFLKTDMLISMIINKSENNFAPVWSFVENGSRRNAISVMPNMEPYSRKPYWKQARPMRKAVPCPPCGP